MICGSYYNEIEPYAAAWLRNLISNGLIPPGDVDERSIALVQPDDVRGYTQCHWFAGLGGWAYAARLAGWPDERPIWTGSCPCQPFSVAGKGAGADDPRHLWPDFFRLIRAVRPPVVMGEQVAGAAGYGWFDGVRSDLAGEDYASRAADVPACAVDAPHIRNRIYWVAVADPARGEQRRACKPAADHGPRQRTAGGHSSGDGTLADAAGRALGQSNSAGRGARQLAASPLGYRHPALSTGRDGAVVAMGNADEPGLEGWSSVSQCSGQRPSRPSGVARNGTFWSDHVWLSGADGKARRVRSCFRLLASGIPARVPKLRALGNAITAPLAAEVIAAFMEAAHAA